MPRCDDCGKEVVLSCAEERSNHYRCFECYLKYEARCQYMHNPTVKALVDALRLCAPYANQAGKNAARRALKNFGGLNASIS